jgi:hypothetical protein
LIEHQEGGSSSIFVVAEDEGAKIVTVAHVRQLLMLFAKQCEARSMVSGGGWENMSKAFRKRPVGICRTSIQKSAP